MLTVPEAACKFGCAPQTIRRWIREGKLSARKVGTQYLIDERDLETVRGSWMVPLPDEWQTTLTGEPMPDWIGLLRRSRAYY